MPSSLYIYGIAVINNRTRIALCPCRYCKARQTVKPCNYVGILLQCPGKASRPSYYIHEQACFQCNNFLLGTHYFLLVLFQFLGNIAFSRHQGLLPDPFGRNHRLVSISYLQVIAEYIVISDFQALYSRPFSLPLLHINQIVLAPRCNLPQFVQLGIHTGSNDTSLGNQCRCIRHNTLFQPLPQLQTQLQTFRYFA